MRLLRPYGTYVRVLLKGMMEYRLNFWTDFLSFFITNIAAYASVWIIMNRFQVINGWTYFEVMVLGVFRNPGGKSGSRGDTDGVEIEAAEMKVDGVAESFAVAEPAR